MISEDVNVVFAYLDAKHKFHRETMTFVKTNKRRKNIMLANVVKNFLVTYEDYINEVARAIESSIDTVREGRKKSPIKSPSLTHITRLIEAEIEQGLREISERLNYSYNSLETFKDLLLTDFSLIELFFEQDKVGDFRDKFIVGSSKLSVEAISLFVDEFPNNKLMKQHHYKSYDKKLKMLSKMKDYEDRRICAELFCFGKEHGPITFLSFDNKFNKFIKAHGKDYRVKTY